MPNYEASEVGKWAKSMLERAGGWWSSVDGLTKEDKDVLRFLVGKFHKEEKPTPSEKKE